MAQLDHNITQKLAECVDTQTKVTTPLERFNAAYITATELTERLNVTRPTVLQKLKGRFPVIRLGNMYFWERTYALEEFVTAWELMRK